MSVGLEDLTAGALLLVTRLHFPAINCIPGCTLTKPSDCVKGYRSPGEDHVWSRGGVSHSHQESRLKNPHDHSSRLDPDLGGPSMSCTADPCCWNGWLVPLHRSSHMPLGLPHRHISPSATPTGKPQDQNGSESVPGARTGGEELSFPVLLNGLESRQRGCVAPSQKISL